MLSVYEKELLALVHVVQKWEQYLSNNSFIIKIDQKSLKWLLQQKISTPFQQLWLSKLMGFTYEIQYKKGKENVAADALFRVQGAEVLCAAISMASSDLEELIQESYSLSPDLQKVVQQLQEGKKLPGLKLINGLIRRNKILIGPSKQLKYKIFLWLHATPEGGHSGRDGTTKRAKQLFHWKGLNRDIRQFVKKCMVCQANKYDTTAKPGLLQPLPIPQAVWTNITMDFITGLPKSMGKEVIFVVVDRFSKAAHFMALAHPFTALQVVQCYLDHVFKLHGWPKSIVSDRDAVFLSKFWRGLFSIHGTEFKLSSSYHPETDGQTEVLNRCLETYLRCMCGGNPKDWCMWLPVAEFWYNTHYHTSTNLTPYEIVYNQPPPLHLPYLAGDSPNDEVDRSMLRREAMINKVKFQLNRAVCRMKQLADKRRSYRNFEEGDWVWLKLQPYRQTSLQLRGNQKLSQKYYGPYKVLAKVGKVAYKLQLPSTAKIHNVFHVSQLKSFYGASPLINTLPDWIENADPTLSTEPEVVIDQRNFQDEEVTYKQYLVQWKGSPAYEATWIVNELLSLPDINVNALNSQHKTALDIAEDLPLSEESAVIKESLVRNNALRANELNQPRDELRKTVSQIKKDVHLQLEQTKKTNINVSGIAKELRKLHREGINNATNSVTVVAVLFATVAFAAIFTVPGGDDDNGKAVASKTASFKIFFIFNAIALFTSLAVVVVQITLVRGETKAERRVVEIINKLMWLASVCTSVAFMASSYIVVGRHHEWAATLVTVVGGVIMAGVLGTMTFYVVKSKRSRSIKKRDRSAKRSGSNSFYHSEFSNSEPDRFYAL